MAKSSAFGAGRNIYQEGSFCSDSDDEDDDESASGYDSASSDGDSEDGLGMCTAYLYVLFSEIAESSLCALQ